MPLGGRKNKGKKPAPMMQLDTAEDPLAQSYAVRGGARGEEVVLGMGAGSKSKGDEVTINSEGITFRGDTKRLNEQDLEEFYPGGDNFLGRGAAGMVELMRIRATGAAVAVKHIAVDDKNDRDQTIQEVESMWRLNHPNIVLFHGAYLCQADHTVCFVLEFMNANSLQHLLKRSHETPMDEAVVSRITEGVLAGIGYLHDQRIVHRDLKPGNVLCHHDEWTVTVKVADFGIVKEMEGEFATTGVGTVAYMSPERLHVDDRVGYGFAADVWAAGLIAGECACGVHLYPAEVQSVQWEYMAYVQDEPTPNLDRERYSPEICDLIDMCLQKEQRHRPSAQHLLQHPFVTNTQSTRLMVVNDPRLGCDILRVRLTEEVVGSFLEHYYATLREDPRRLFELYCDDSVCELAGVGTHRGAEEICGCLDEIYGGSLMIEPDPQRVNLVEMEGGRGYEARVEGTLLLKQDGEDGRPKEFADVLRVVSEGMTLLVEFESHECWE